MQGFPRPRLWWMPLLLMVSLVAHYFDACTSHVGSINAQTAGTLTSLSNSDCSHDAIAACGVCSPNDRPTDLCEVVSEFATITHQGFDLDAPVVLSSPAALPEIALRLNPPAGILRNRDGPDVSSLYSLCSGSTLLGRSPPLSA